MKNVVVVGASLAGVRACGGLRAGGFDGVITLIGNELHQPYDRPPLSKKVLSGEWEPERLALIRPDEVDTLSLDIRLGVPAASLSTAERYVTLADGSTIDFDGLVIATGSGTRRLPNQLDDPHVVELRTLDDSLALRAMLAGGDRRLAIIGAGFIGLEVAATARMLGNDVTILEGLPAPLIRGLGPEMGRAVSAMHGDHGVDIRCGVRVLGIERVGDDLVVAAEIDGSQQNIACDVVVVGIGVSPNTAWLADSGLELRDGIVCDDTLNAGVEGVYAAGDVARWPNQLFGGEEMRAEHWTNAAEQGLAVARNLLATSRGEEPLSFAPVPFFWSDQYKTRIQFLGWAGGDDEVRIVKGSIEDRSFLALYGRAGRLRAALGLGMPKPLMQCRKLLLEQVGFDEATEVAAAL